MSKFVLALSRPDQCGGIRAYDSYRGSEARTAFLEYREGRVTAEEFVLRNQSLLVIILRPLFSLAESVGLEREDLLQEGRLGILRAMKGYDPSRNQFSTYVRHWILAYGWTAIFRHDERSGGHIGDKIGKLRGAVEKVLRERRQQGETRTPSVEEVQEALERHKRASCEKKGKPFRPELLPTRAAVRLALDLTRVMVFSLDEPIQGEDNRRRGDSIPDETGFMPPDEQADRRQELRWIFEVFRKLNAFADELERFPQPAMRMRGRILRLRYSLERLDPPSIRAIAQHVGLSRERVRQLLEDAVRRFNSDRTPQELIELRERFFQLKDQIDSGKR